MPGIIPDIGNGGVVVRDVAGNCLAPLGVTNDYCPNASFTASCALRFLPNDCTARISSAQINAFQSEMLCLAETLNPDGNWNCGSTCNLGNVFSQWAASAANYDGSMLDYMERHLCARPLMTDFDTFPNAGIIVCDGAGVVRRARPGIVPQYVVDGICAALPMRGQLATCLTSTDPANIIQAGGDGLLFAQHRTALQTANLLCGNPAALTALQACLGPYPTVVAGTGTTVVPTTLPSGQIQYTISATAGADTDISAVELDIIGNTLRSRVTEDATVLSDSVPLDFNPSCLPVAAATKLATDRSVQQSIRAHLVSLYRQDVFQPGGGITRAALNTGNVVSTGAGASISFTNPFNCPMEVELVAAREHAQIDLFGFGGVMHTVSASVTRTTQGPFTFGLNQLHQNIVSYNASNDGTAGFRSDTGAAQVSRRTALLVGETVTLTVTGFVERIGNANIIAGETFWILDNPSPIISDVAPFCVSGVIYSATIRGVMAGVI